MAESALGPVPGATPGSIPAAGVGRADGRPGGRSKDVAWMTIGTLLIGVSGYVVLSVAGHGRLTAADAATLAALYLLVTISGPGVFVGLEQELSRRISRAIATGAPTAPIAAAVARVGIVVAIITALVGVGGTLLLGSHVLGNGGLLIALAISIVGSAAVFWVRGLAGGQRRFRAYGVTMLIDAGVRIVGCVVLAFAGVQSPLGYGLVLCVSPLVAAALTGPGLRPPHTNTRAPAQHGLVRSISSLLVASAIAMAMANLAPVLVTAQLAGDPALAYAFSTAVVLTRVPLLLMGPVQAMALPGLTAAVTHGRQDEFRHQLTRGLMIIAGVGVAAVVGTLLLGRFVIGLMFGDGADLVESGRLVLLASSAVLLMAVQLLQPALVALGRHTGLVTGWVTGAIVFGVVFLFPLGPLDAATIAMLAGPLATLVVHLTLVRLAPLPHAHPGPTAG